MRAAPLSRFLATTVLLAGAISGVVTGMPAGGGAGAAPGRPSYTNPIVGLNTADVTVAFDPARHRYVMVSSSLPWGREAPPRLRGPHSLPVFTSPDMVHWTYRHQLHFDAGPGQQAAPYLARIGGRWVMYFAMFNQDRPGSRIRVATTTGDPAGEGWSLQRRPLVPPSHCRNDYGRFCLTIGPTVVTVHGRHYLYYGSFRGGIHAVRLSRDGLRRVGATRDIGHAARYEATDVVRHGGWFYLFASTAPCCQGPTTAYSVVVSRSRHWDGPFVDRLGVPMVSPGKITKDYGRQGGGEPFLKPHGDRWQGVGSNTVVTDAAGQDWTYYYGVDQRHGFVNGLPVRHGRGYGPHRDQRATYRQTLLDQVTWTDDGWPVVNGGRGPSTRPMPMPATRVHPGSSPAPSVVASWVPPTPTTPLPAVSTSFDSMPPGYRWVHHRGRLVHLSGGRLTVKGRGDLAGSRNSAHNLLLTDPPGGDYVVETRVSFDPDRDGQQAGLVVYRDDDRYLKLVKAKNRSLTLSLSARETIVRNPHARRGRVPCPFGSRQGHPGTSYDASHCPSFGEEWGYPASLSPARNGRSPHHPRSPLWLRIYRHGASYAMWSSPDGQTWHQLNTWRLGADDRPVRVGLLAISRGAGRPVPARFGYLTFSRYAE